MITINSPGFGTRTGASSDNSKMKSKKWTRFERWARIQEELAPDAVVTHNDKIRGKVSGTFRQIDVSVKKQVGQYQIFIAIDCKDLARPADVKDVEEVIGLFKDIQANKGAIVSAKGFTPAAKARGQSAGLELYRLVDTGEHEWHAFVTIPMVYDFRGPSKYRLKFAWTGPFSTRETIGPAVSVYDEDGNLLGTIADLMKKRWNEGALPIDPGEQMGVDVIGQRTFMKGPAGLLKLASQLTFWSSRGSISAMFLLLRYSD